MQWMLKIGVWAKKQMDGEGDLGSRMLRSFWMQEQKRVSRQKAHRIVPNAAAISP